ncbi:MAG: DUF6029 family protein [Candidatus Eisenbacteria bacterium]
MEGGTMRVAAILRTLALGGAALFALTGPGLRASAQADDLPGNLCSTNRAGVWIEEGSRAASYLNQFDLQYSRGPWLLGARLEFDEEQRYDPESFDGISRRFAEYRGTFADVRAGTFYATFGRGLLLRAEEDEIVRLDRDIDGVRGSVRWKGLAGQALCGRPRNDETRQRDDLLSGLELRYALTPGLAAGAGYVRRDASRDGSATTAHDLVLGEPVEELAGGSIQWSRGFFDGVVEAAQRYVWGMRDPREGWIGVSDGEGRAVYGAFTFSLPGYAWLIEGKHYRDFDAPYSTLPPANTAGQPINGGRDERGLGVTLTANRGDDLFETAWSWAEAAHEPGARLAVEGSARRDWWGRGALELGGEWVREEELESHSLRAYSGPRMEAVYYLTPATSLELHAKAQSWTNQVRGSEPQDYREVALDLSLSVGYARGATLSLIHASEPIAEYDSEDTWIALELAWSFSDNHNLKVRFGEERGGIVCSGGVCHYEPPFAGVRAELTSRL